MGLFGKKKDWNVIAVMFETKAEYRVNGNRAKGSMAKTVRDGAKNHERTILWAVFDQKRAFLEGEPGPGHKMVSLETQRKLTRELPTIKTVQDILTLLEEGKIDKAAKALVWTGYPVEKSYD
ncbi:MAG: hypothetical protein IID45_00180 [Planctomycetes bacterium]|nr:hypothetical protein [Planctomycetota bacterium]